MAAKLPFKWILLNIILVTLKIQVAKKKIYSFWEFLTHFCWTSASATFSAPLLESISPFPFFIFVSSLDVRAGVSTSVAPLSEHCLTELGAGMFSINKKTPKNKEKIKSTVSWINTSRMLQFCLIHQKPRTHKNTVFLYFFRKLLKAAFQYKIGGGLWI